MKPGLTAILKLLADPTRLRLLGLLAREELAVGELARAVAMSQSRVSNHLKLLREFGLLEERRAGTFVHVRLARSDALPDDLWSAIEARLANVDGRDDDLKRLDHVLDERRKKSRVFFDRVAPEWDKLGSEFKRGSIRWRALAALVPQGMTVADVGCGTGYMARTLVRVAERVVCIDHSAAMLEQARSNLASYAGRVEFRQGELDRLPLADGEVDAIFASLVLHHVPDVVAALREMRRSLKRDGLLVVTELLPHKEAWMAETMADLRLGLDATELKSRAERAGFADVLTDVADDAYVVEAPTGRKAELPLFVLEARARGGIAARESKKNPEATPETIIVR
jgi:ubiquinone/menaquinone biosynthesis C-methylase UbiE